MFFEGESARGPSHEAPPSSGYASVWALWLSVMPYGLWSDRIAVPSMDEYREWLALLESTFREALDRFGARLRPGVLLSDVAVASAALIEGHWLNQCLVGSHPLDDDTPIVEAPVRSGRLLWRGAIEGD